MRTKTKKWKKSGIEQRLAAAMKRCRAGAGKSRCICILALLVFASATLRAAQGGSVSPPVVPQAGELHLPPNTRVIQGKVTDAHGSTVSGAVVLLKDSKTLQIRSYLAQADGSYRFYGLSTDVNYQVRAETGDMTSPTKLVSVFDSKKFIKVDLKIKNKKKRDKS